MSAEAIAVGAAVGIGISLGGMGLFTLLRGSERAELKRADRFAREQDLWLPPEFARPVGARLRRREGLGQLLSALVAAPVFGWSFAEMSAHLHEPVVPGQIYFFPGPLIFFLTVLPVGLINVAVHLWDVTLAARRAGTPAVAAAPTRLEGFVPRWATWAARVLAVVPPFVAAVICVLHRQGEPALLFTALGAAAGVATWGAERAQVRLMTPRRVPAIGPELAFDEAFRATTVLSTVMTVPLVVGVAGAECCVTLHGPGLLAPLLFEGWTVLAVLMAFLGNVFVSARGVRRYYRRRLSSS